MYACADALQKIHVTMDIPVIIFVSVSICFCCQCYTHSDAMLLQTAGEVQGFQGEYDNKAKYGFEGAVWRGDLITEGGGFCGARTKVCCLAPVLGFETPLP